MFEKLVKWSRKKSPWIFHVSAGSCNNCDIERFGILLKGSPRHADILVVTGIVNRQAAPRVRRVYEQTPDPKLVVALGNCAVSGGIFKNGYNMVGPVDKVIPVDVYVMGCPPRPQAIIDGIVEAIKKYEVIKV